MSLGVLMKSEIEKLGNGTDRSELRERPLLELPYTYCESLLLRTQIQSS